MEIPGARRLELNASGIGVWKKTKDAVLHCVRRLFRGEPEWRDRLSGD